VRPIGVVQVTVTPAEVVGGRTAAGQVTLECPAPANGLVVTLSSSHPSVRAPASVTVAGGATAASFTVTTEYVSARQNVLLSATSGGTVQSTALTVLPDPPSAPPSQLAATVVSPSQIRLTWRDNSANETGFEIERKTGNASFQRIATAAANSTTFTDSSLTPNTAYAYRVRAVNASGPSAYSNEATATTPSVPPPPLAPLMRRIAVFRLSTQEWFLREGDGTASIAQFGGPGDVPAPADYLGTGSAQIAVFRPGTREWFLRTGAGLTLRVPFAAPADVPVPADYAGLGRAQIAVYRQGPGEWYVRHDLGTATILQFGGPEDQPVPADYLGLRRAQIAVYRPRTGEWFVRREDGGTVLVQWGAPGDIPIPGDYFGLGRTQIAVYRPSTAEFFLRDDLGRATVLPFGVPGDVPVPADYHGIGRPQIAVYRPATGEWFVRADNGAVTRVQWGGLNDVPVPAAFAPRFSMVAAAADR
jgi:hypothetical protein